MAVTKIHPIKTTLKKSIDYICNKEKTDDEVYVKTHLCTRELAFKEFEMTRKEFHSKTKTLAHHLIQSFMPGEVSFEKAHEVGNNLCDSIFDGKFEYVLATHIDKGHIHNHIIFNSVDSVEGKIYRSYYGSYMKIRNESDRICRENNLSVIDSETSKEYSKVMNRVYENWYEWNQDKQGKSYKSKLQIDINRSIKSVNSFEEFLRKMKELGYEIKFGKHIAFKHKDKERFTRSKTLGINFTEEKIKERIKNKNNEIDSIIDISKNPKVKNSKAYEFWATKHNLQTSSKSILLLRQAGYKSKKEVDEKFNSLKKELARISENGKKLTQEKKNIKELSKYIHIYMQTKPYADAYNENKTSLFNKVHKKEIEKYQKSKDSIRDILKEYPELKTLLRKSFNKDSFKKLNEKLDNLEEEIENLKQIYISKIEEKEQFEKLIKNYEDYMKPSTLDKIKEFEKEVKNKEKTNTKNMDIEL
ncbi:MAG: relaxase/mobilization nuclease domain-containing protein [Tissierellia bacterium]|nr:relaxase/mobilization nuclease domain-containing protein [Tissierellia bacterium]